MHDLKLNPGFQVVKTAFALFIAIMLDSISPHYFRTYSIILTDLSFLACKLIVIVMLSCL